MDYGKSLGKLIENLDGLLRVINVVDSGVIGKIEEASNKVDSLNMDEIRVAQSTADKLLSKYQDIKLALASMPDISSVASMRNQIDSLFEIKDSIIIASDNIDDISNLAEYKNHIGAVIAIKPMIEEVLALTTKIDSVLDIEEKMDAVINLSPKSIEAAYKVSKLHAEAKTYATEARKSNELIAKAESRIDEKLKKIEGLVVKSRTMEISVEHLTEHDSPYSSYDQDTNRLVLGIPSGKTGPRGKYKGDKGEPGRNGSSFSPSYFGRLLDRNMYSGYPVGISFLSLDEIPTMIYFRKSNALDDWTDGQPFGVSNGGYSDEENGIDIVNGINIDEITTHILNNIKRRDDG